MSHVPVFDGYSGLLSACGRSSVVSEPVKCGNNRAALGLLTYPGQPGVAEGNEVHTQT